MSSLFVRTSIVPLNNNLKFDRCSVRVQPVLVAGRTSTGMYGTVRLLCRTCTSAVQTELVRYYKY